MSKPLERPQEVKDLEAALTAWPQLVGLFEHCKSFDAFDEYLEDGTLSAEAVRLASLVPWAQETVRDLGDGTWAYLTGVFHHLATDTYWAQDFLFNPGTCEYSWGWKDGSPQEEACLKQVLKGGPATYHFTAV